MTYYDRKASISMAHVAFFLLQGYASHDCHHGDSCLLLYMTKTGTLSFSLRLKVNVNLFIPEQRYNVTFSAFKIKNVLKMS
jgi:hypothetical protein